MKKYTEILKEVKNYFYLYCDKCDEVYIDDLYYLRVQKFCPKCGSVPFVIKSDSNQSLNKEQVKKEVNEYIEKQKLDKIRENILK